MKRPSLRIVLLVVLFLATAGVAAMQWLWSAPSAKLVAPVQRRPARAAVAAGTPARPAAGAAAGGSSQAAEPATSSGEAPAPPQAAVATGQALPPAPAAPPSGPPVVALSGGGGRGEPLQAARAAAAEAPPKVRRFADRLLAQYDGDGNGQLDPLEWKAMRGDPAAVDLDGDGLISRWEMISHVAAYGRHRRIRLTGSMVEAAAELPPLLVPTSVSPEEPAKPQPGTEAAGEAEVADGEATPAEPPAMPASRAGMKFYVPPSRLKGLPSWFLARDTDGDGQVTMAEYAPQATNERLQEFDRLDLNHDGVVTAKECPRAKSASKPAASGSSGSAHGGVGRPAPNTGSTGS